jgi:hypothetical protein
MGVVMFAAANLKKLGFGWNVRSAVSALVGGPELDWQIILWPTTDSNSAATSYGEYADGYHWLRA